MKVSLGHGFINREERELFVARFEFATFYLGIPLVLLFTLIDLHFPWETVLSLLKGRLLAVPVGMGALALYRIPVLRTRFYFVPAYLFAAYLGGYLAFVASQAGLSVSPYYFGLNLVGVAAFTFLPWTGIHLFLSGLVLFGPYLAVMIAAGPAPSYFMAHLAFCLSTVGIGVITNFSTRRLREREVTSRVRLMSEIADKNRLIEQKTQEGAYLERLAAQFSPQVIEGVKAGRVSVEGLQQREITCLFIDVQSSTNRSVRLDQADYTKILSEFFSEAVALLLKHDVTIANYLGDGLLAFANAPEDQPDHRARVVHACLAILQMHYKRQRYFVEKWRSEFNIRIGVNSGQAFVGFFPSYRLGTYTAIGASVNLANRLCAQAAPNSMLVTKAFLREIGHTLRDVNVRHQETVSSLKGFEGETFELCAIEPKVDATAQNPAHCPHCAAEVVESNNLGDYALVRCVVCGRSDLLERHALAGGR